MSAMIDVHAPPPWTEDDFDFVADEEIGAQILDRFGACATPSDAFFEGMESEGVDRAGLARVGQLMRFAWVVYVGADGFEFADDRPGEAATIALVFLILDHLGTPIDIAAWSPPRPAALWHARGCMIGEDGIFAPRMTATAALLVHPSPREWLRAGGRGVVPIDWAKAASLLRRAAPLQAASLQQGLELRDRLEVRPVRILVPAGA
ncbi:MAG: hypothetical protein ACHQAY_27300 [Hyphomicrobiales bacterium]